MDVLLLCNRDLSTNIIFSKIIKRKDINVIGIGYTMTVATEPPGIKSMLSLSKKMSFRYFIFLGLTNGLFKICEKFEYLLKIKIYALYN